MASDDDKAIPHLEALQMQIPLRHRGFSCSPS